MLSTTLITTQAIWTVMNIPERDTSIFLDRSYMAYKRMIKMTCMLFESSQLRETLQLSSSPPSMTFVTKDIHLQMK
jgi:hypothetical protein